MGADCLFCKIAEKKIPSKVVDEDEGVFAFDDIGLPGAAKMHLVAAELARKLKRTDGYRTVVNTGSGAGQTVFHLHLHLLGGREFGGPPGGENGNSKME